MNYENGECAEFDSIQKKILAFECYAQIFADSIHKPVMPREVLGFIGESGKLKIIDATVGCGGHSSLILKKNPAAVLLGIDRDLTALEAAEKRLFSFKDRAVLKSGTLSEIKTIAAETGWSSADIILMDLGISSLQLEDSERGFSYRTNAPLDMRMGLGAKKTAADLLNSLSENELEKIFREFGEIKRSRKLANEVVRERKKSPILTTEHFAEICKRIPGLTRMKGDSSPTLPFQALRIAVNDELNQLKQGLKSAVELLSEGGIIIVISFNSLEDRIVKNFFKTESKECICPPERFVCVCEHRKTLKLLSKKPLLPKEDEIMANSRAASAKLRAAKKINF